jgi:hypothetical protein
MTPEVVFFVAVLGFISVAYPLSRCTFDMLCGEVYFDDDDDDDDFPTVTAEPIDDVDVPVGTEVFQIETEVT